MANFSDFLTGGGGGHDPRRLPLDMYADGAFYQPYPTSGESGHFVTTGSNKSVFLLVPFPEDVKIKSFSISMNSSNEERGIEYGLYALGANVLTRGTEIFSGTVADNTFSSGDNNIVLSSPVDVDAGFYLFGISGLGVLSNDSPNLRQIVRLATERTFDLAAFQPAPSNLLNNTDGARIVFAGKLSSSTAGSALTIEDTQVFAASFEVGAQ